MASDIKINEKAGTFYSTVQPPAFSGTNGGLLHQTWGSRVAEMSGRVRGLAGSVWVSYGVGYVVWFPTNFFKNVPIVEASVLLPKLTDPNHVWLGGLKNEWCIDFSYWNGGKETVSTGGGISILAPTKPVVTTPGFGNRSLPDGDYIVPIEQAPVYMSLMAVGSLSFDIISDSGLYGGANANRYKSLTENPLLVFWHAFGC